METRPRTRLLRRAVITAALGALVVPASAGAATKTPVITKVTPKNVAVGETLTIHGKNFRSGKAKNTVLFKRDGGKALFVKAGLSTKKKITVAIPKKLEKYMSVKSSQPAASRFRLRVLTTKLSKRFTTAKASPTIGPEKVKPPTNDGGGTGTVTLDPNADNDGDGLNNAFEQTITKTDPVLSDSDGDGATDGYEYSSAVDLNNDDYSRPTASLPYAGKRPYPNPLDASDQNVDHDGDALTLLEEFELWQYSVANGAQGSVMRLNYSAGLKYSIFSGGDGTRRVPALAAAGYDKQAAFASYLSNSGYSIITEPRTGAAVNFFDLDRSGGALRSAFDADFNQTETSPYDNHGSGGGDWGDGWLSDDERDEDADGLTNWIELHGPMLPSWYASRYKDEKAYVVEYAGVSPIDPDSDGDGLRDGADDQDHDDIPNFRELSRNMADPVGGWDDSTTTLAAARLTPLAARVNPYNPCLPYTDSRTCPISIPFANAWAPFNRPEQNFFVYY